MVKNEIVQHNNVDITLEVNKHDNGLVELSINYNGTPVSIMLDKDNVQTLIDELAYTRYLSSDGIKILKNKTNENTGGN